MCESCWSSGWPYLWFSILFSLLYWLNNHPRCTRVMDACTVLLSRCLYCLGASLVPIPPQWESGNKTSVNNALNDYCASHEFRYFRSALYRPLSLALHQLLSCCYLYCILVNANTYLQWWPHMRHNLCPIELLPNICNVTVNNNSVGQSLLTNARTPKQKKSKSSVAYFDYNLTMSLFKLFLQLSELFLHIFTQLG